MNRASQSAQKSQDPVERFRPLAALALSTSADEKWTEPLARLYEAASRGIGHLPLHSLGIEGDLSDLPADVIAIEAQRAMLPKMASAWQRIRRNITQRHSQMSSETDDPYIAEHLNRLLPPYEEQDETGAVLFSNRHQRQAVAGLIDVQVGVLTGGPGTGKTTTAAALLALRCTLDPSLSAEDIIICAPTGKAANRLKQSLDGAIKRLDLTEGEADTLKALHPITLHRALGWTPTPPEDGGPWRFNQHRPLRTKLVLIDEASMADTELMAALLAALPDQAALILLGDRDQLDSVEAGGVLGELVTRGSAGTINEQRMMRLSARCNGWEDDTTDQHLTQTAGATITDPLPGLTYSLQWSFRAKDAPWILNLATLLQPGTTSTANDVLNFCHTSDNNNLQWIDQRSQFIAHCNKQWHQLKDGASSWRLHALPSDQELRQHLVLFQVLVATNQQAADYNARGQQQFMPSYAGKTSLSHGCPIMISLNDAQLDVANGDMGIALGDGPGSPAIAAIFPGMDKALPLSRLPAFGPAFAITIHKSQGSEWEQVAIDVGQQPTPLLDRRLCYTAVTRASKSLRLTGSKEALNAALISNENNSYF